MSTWYEWSVLCPDGHGRQITYTTTSMPPTACPRDPVHILDADNNLIVRSISETNPTVKDFNENRVLVSIGMFPDFMNPVFFSRGDNFAAGTRGDGDLLVVSHAHGETTKTTIVEFVDPIQLIGATLRAYNTNIADTISFEAYAPASPVSATTPGTGNCILHNVGFGNVIVPFANGTHNVDLTAPINNNLAGEPGQPTLVAAVVPVPATDDITHMPNGYFNYDDATGAVTPANGNGKYNLFDVAVPLFRYVNSMSVYGTPFKEEVGVNHRSGLVLPHWKSRIYTTRDSSHPALDPPVIYTIVMKAARQKTY